MKTYITLVGAALMAVSASGVAQAAQPTGTTERSSVSQEVVIRVAPPVARYEYIGRPPSARHFWVNGHHYWTGREYVWNPGRWEVRRDGYNWVHAHYVYTNGGYHFIPGYWR